MGVLSLLLNMTGGLCMFLFGMKIMSDGLQKSAGDKMRKALNFMTGNRFAGMLTGLTVTSIIQSSSAVSVIIISFVNAGLITLTQSIGVIFGANIGTTMTGWIVSVFGFNLSISSLALPAVGIGFILSLLKWKYKSLGDFLVGFGLLFLGLHYLADGMGGISKAINFDAIAMFKDMGYLAILIGYGTGLLMTVLIHSSSASVAIIMTMAFNGIVTYEMAAGMVLGANLGTTIDGVLAAIAGNTAAKRAALVHVLFNAFGVIWALPLLMPILRLVDFVIPGNPVIASTGGLVTENIAVTTHLAGLHTIYNIISTILFLPFVKQFARFVSFLIRGKENEEISEHYNFEHLSAVITESPELNILRVEKEISDMAGIVSFMYSRFCTVLRGLREGGKNNEEDAANLCAELLVKEEYIDEMREALSGFLIECSGMKLNARSEFRVSNLLRVIVALEEMSDECYSISRLLEKSVRKNNIFNANEMEDLIPYVGQVEEFLALLEKQLGGAPTEEQKTRAAALEDGIDKNRKKLHRLGRKRIEAGGNVKAELLFIDLVRRIEKLGDYCFEISGPLELPRNPGQKLTQIFKNIRSLHQESAQ
jgi:phosphate:Na+ symporter